MTLFLSSFKIGLPQARELTERERIGRAVGAIGGVLRKGSLTFIADRTRFNNIAIKLKQLRCSDQEVGTRCSLFCRLFFVCVPNMMRRMSEGIRG